MLVRVLKAHSNGYGDGYEKAVGAEYEHPSPGLLISRGKVEPTDGKASRQDKRVSGARKGSVRTVAKGDGAKRHKASGKGRARADGRRRGPKGA